MTNYDKKQQLLARLIGCTHCSLFPALKGEIYRNISKPIR